MSAPALDAEERLAAMHELYTDRCGVKREG